MTGLLDPATAPTPSEVAALPTPTTAAEWLERARLERRVLATDAAERDRAGADPHAEVALLKESGLVTLLGPASTAAAGRSGPRLPGDPGGRRRRRSIGQLLGYHLLWFWAARWWAPASRSRRGDRRRRGNNGSSVARSTRATPTSSSPTRVTPQLHGRKSFSTGKVSDVTVLEGVLESTGSTCSRSSLGPARDHLPRRLGQHRPAPHRERQRHHRQRDHRLGVGCRLRRQGFPPRVYNSLNVPIIQLVFVNF